ncbi:hypothetical protein [Rhodoflexus sp.]
MKYIWVVLICTVTCLSAAAQNTRAGKSSSESRNSQVFMREQSDAKKFGLRYKKAPTHNAYAEARLKERQKIAEEMKKPQYADKMYFGHKRPPKKRPLHKRKFCKECGIVH